MNANLNIASAVKAHIELSLELSCLNASQSYIDDTLNAHWRHDLPASTAFTYCHDYIDYQLAKARLAA